MTDIDEERAASAERWEQASEGWGRFADRMRAFGMPVSGWMIEHARLQPGQRVLELAAGPGDTGFLAAELIQPGGALVSSDHSEGMLAVARRRASAQGIDNVEFKRLSVEWIDMPTASVDVILCRWGIMLVPDPEAAVHEARRVLAPGGRIAVVVWDEAELNPWATIPQRALVELRLAEPPDPAAPGMFTLASNGSLQELLESAGFLDVELDSIPLRRFSPGLDDYIDETVGLSAAFAALMGTLADTEREQVSRRIGELAEPFTQPDGSFTFPGRSLAAAADA